MNELLGKIVAGLVAAAVLVAVACAFIAEAITHLVCGVRPTPSSLFSGLIIAISGDATTYAAPAECAVPVALIRIADTVALLVIVGLAIAIVVAWRRYQSSDRSFIGDLRTRPGFAAASEIRGHLSAKAVLRRAVQLRPDVTRPTPADVGWRVGRSRGMDVYVSIEDSVALEGPPRSGKGY